jgi:hypothetical protein
MWVVRDFALKLTD